MTFTASLKASPTLNIVTWLLATVVSERGDGSCNFPTFIDRPVRFYGFIIAMPLYADLDIFDKLIPRHLHGVRKRQEFALGRPLVSGN